MFTLSVSILAILFFAVFWAGICFGAALGIYFSNRRHKKTLDQMGATVHKAPSGKPNLISINGERGKKND